MISHRTSRPTVISSDKNISTSNDTRSCAAGFKQCRRKKIFFISKLFFDDKDLHIGGGIPMNLEHILIPATFISVGVVQERRKILS